MRNFKIGSGEAAMRFNGDDTSAAITWNGVESYSITSGGLRLRNVATADLPTSPPIGTTVYDTTSESIKTWDGTAWNGVGGGSVDFSSQTSTTATGAATTSEILDHYEEGTWTPNLWDNSLSSAEGQTYFIQYGFFTRIGRVVFLEGYLGVTSIGTLTTAQVCNIGPLPYTSSSATGYSGSASFVDTSGLAMTATGCSMAGRIPTGVNYLTISEWDVITGTSGFLVSQISEPASFFFSGTYFI